MQLNRLCQIGVLISAIAVHHAATASADDFDEMRRDINKGVVGVMAARADSAFTRFSEDLSILLDDRNNLRVLSIMGKGSLTNIYDLLLLRGVDVAFAQADVINYLEQTGTFPDIKERIRYITTLNREEMHILAPTRIRSVWELEGKAVNFGPTGTGTFMTSSVVFNDLGINVRATTFPHNRAMDELQAGTIDAVIKVDGAPADLFADLAAGLKQVPAGPAYHFLEVPVNGVNEVYSAASLSADAYPNIIPKGKTIPTISVASVLVAYNFGDDNTRGQNVDRFIEAFFSNFSSLQTDQSFDPKWQEVDLNEELPGWTRVDSASRLLSN